MSWILRDSHFGKRKSVHTLILTLIFIFFTSCNNIGIFQNGGLVVVVPSSRSASESTIFTVIVADTAGNKQSKTIVAGESAQFDDLVPGQYSITVEGKESGISTMYGATEVSVVAGKTAGASVSLSTVAHTFEALQLLIEKGGTVSVGSDIEFTSGLQVKDIDVKIVPLKNVVLKNNSTEPLFTVETSSLTLGGGEYTLTLDGNNQAQHGVKVTEASFSLEKNTVITNCANSGVYITSANFTMNGGTITQNTAVSGGGVYIFDGPFEMYDGSITENKLTDGSTSDGGGIYIEKGDFTMNGGSITNHTVGIKRGGAIAVKETALFTMNAGTISGNAASSDGGGIYLFGSSSGDKGRCILNGGSITNNNCDSNGGGISVSGECTVNNGAIITENTCSRGGDIFVYSGFTYTNSGGTVGDVVIQP